MKKTIALRQKGFESSSTTTPEFLVFVRVFNKEFKAVVEKYHEVKEWKMSKGHFYVSGFFLVGAQWYYYSMSDVRFFPNDGLLIRAAKHPADYTGGANNMQRLEADSFMAFLPN